MIISPVEGAYTMAGNRRPVLGIYPYYASLGEGRRRLQGEEIFRLSPGKARSKAFAEGGSNGSKDEATAADR
jgi:hypothetical protein